MNHRKTVSWLAFGICVTAGAVLLAQQVQTQPAQPRQPAQPGQFQNQAATGQFAQTGQRPQWMTTDQHVATCLAISNHVEVALAEFALEHSDNDDIKDFAKTLIEDHQAFLKKLERWSPQAANGDFLKESHEEQASKRNESAPKTGIQQAGGANPAQPGARIQQTAGTRTVGAGSQPVNLTQLERELAQECFNTAKQMLSSKEGDEFNKCFAGMQFMVHNHMQDKLTVFQRHVSDDLAQALSDASSTVDEHMTHAEKLMKSFEKNGRVASEDKKEERK